MKKNLLLPTARSVFAAIFMMLAVYAVKAQETKTQSNNKYGEGGTRETTVSQDEWGRTVTTIKIYDGSDPKKLRETSRSMRKADNSGTVTMDTVYYPNGTKKSTSTMEMNDDNSSKMEEFEYSDYDGKIIGGSLRTRVNGRLQIYPWDPKKKRFEGWGEVKQDNPVSKEEVGCKTRADIFGGYNFFSRDNFERRIPMHGATASFTWYFSGSVTRFPVGIKVSANTGSHKNGDETISLNTIRVGPVMGLGCCNERIIPSIHLQAGIARDGYKIMDVKTTGNSFVGSAGGSIDWYFTNNIGLRVSPEALYTRFNGVSQWHFIGSTGIVYEIASKK